MKWRSPARNESGRALRAAEIGNEVPPRHRVDRLYGQESQKPWCWLASV